MTICASNTSQGSQSPHGVLAFAQIGDVHIVVREGFTGRTTQPVGEPILR